MIIKYHSLAVLCHVPRLRGPSPADLPSWVPDWSEKSQFYPGRPSLTQKSPFSALSGDISFGPEGSCHDFLTVHGFRVATVTRNIDPLPRVESRYAPLSTVFRIWDDAVFHAARLHEGKAIFKRGGSADQVHNTPSRNQSRPDSKAGQSASLGLASKVAQKFPAIWEALVRTLMSIDTRGSDPNSYNFERVNLERLNKGAAELLDLMMLTAVKQEDVGFDEVFVFGHPSLSNDAMDFMEYVFLGTLHRSLVLSEEGATGLAPDSVEVGDQVWVLFGCPEPILLRPRSDTLADSRAAGPFSVIGPAYLDGIMRGEILEDLPDLLAGNGVVEVLLQ